jgi:hypothetical protein
MKKVTNLIGANNCTFSLDDLVAVQFSEADFFSQIRTLEENIKFCESVSDEEALRKILSSIKNSKDMKISLSISDWMFLDRNYLISLDYDTLSQYPLFIKAGICPEIVLEIDVDSFCKWLIETTNSQLWDIERELHEKYGSENSSYLNEMVSEAEEFANRLNEYRAWDALDFYKSGGLVKIMVNNQIIRELNYDIDKSEPKERYIFETLTCWLCALSGEAFQNSGLVFFDQDSILKK